MENRIGNCFLCGSEKKKVFAEKNGFNYFQCDNCGLISIDQIPVNLADYYSTGYFTGDLSLDGYVDYENEKKMTWGTLEKYLHLIQEKIDQSGRLFEVGCATGCFLDLANQNGWKVKGIDISDYAVTQAREKGFDVECVTLEDYKPIDSDVFDAVVMFDVVEHLSDPISGFQKVRVLLKDDGILIFATPDSGSWWAKIWNKKWHALVPPQHINIFSIKNINDLLKKNGFKIEYSSHLGKKFSLPYIFRLLNTWTKMKVWGQLAVWTGSKKFFKNLSVPINIGDTMFVIARKIN